MLKGWHIHQELLAATLLPWGERSLLENGANAQEAA